MVYTNLKTTTNLDGVSKWMTRSTHLVLKLRKANHTHMYSNALTVVKTTRQTPTNIYFRSTDSIVTGTTRKSSRSVKTGPNQFAQPWVGSQHDLWLLKALFTKYVQEWSPCQHYTWDLILIWYNFYSRIFIVGYTIYLQLY